MYYILLLSLSTVLQIVIACQHVIHAEHILAIPSVYQSVHRTLVLCHTFSTIW